MTLLQEIINQAQQDLSKHDGILVYEATKVAKTKKKQQLPVKNKEMLRSNNVLQQKCMYVSK